MQEIFNQLKANHAKDPWILWGVLFSVLYAGGSMLVVGFNPVLLCLMSYAFGSVLFLCINAVYGELPVYAVDERREKGMMAFLYRKPGRRLKRRDVRALYFYFIVVLIAFDAPIKMRAWLGLDHEIEFLHGGFSLMSYIVGIVFWMGCGALLRAPMPVPKGYCCRWLKDEVFWVRFMFFLIAAFITTHYFLEAWNDYLSGDDIKSSYWFLNHSALVVAGYSLLAALLMSVSLLKYRK